MMISPDAFLFTVSSRLVGTVSETVDVETTMVLNRSSDASSPIWSTESIVAVSCLGVTFIVADVKNQVTRKNMPTNTAKETKIVSQRISFAPPASFWVRLGEIVTSDSEAGFRLFGKGMCLIDFRSAGITSCKIFFGILFFSIPLGCHVVQFYILNNLHHQDIIKSLH